MEQSPERAERNETPEELSDLPPAPTSDALAEQDADAVRGGRKAGGGQQDYLVITMNDIIVTG